MNRRASVDHEALRLRRRRQRRAGGFTLLEICTVLFIILILMGVTMPAMQSVFVEQAVRTDAHEFSLMVKTAMLQSSEQHRAYVIDLGAKKIALHPVEKKSDDGDPAPNADDVVSAHQLNPPTQLLTPDPDKRNAWVPTLAQTWIFEPGELCPATRVRFIRGKDWLEMSFNPLTGNVEGETAYFP